MSLSRVRFATDDMGSDEYVLILNPTDINIPQAMNNEIKKAEPIIDGETIIFEPYLDTRRGSLMWENIPTDLSINGTAFQNQIDELDSYVGTYKYMDLGTVGDTLGVFGGYTYVKIIAQDKKFLRGGRLVWSKIELFFELAEA